MSSETQTIVIASAARTPVGSFNGALAGVPAHELGAIAIKAALQRAGIEPGDVDEVIMGQILTANTGQNPARQASIAAGIPVDSPAWGINQLCGSGLRTVALGMQQILDGSSKIVVAGGQESMSQAPHVAFLRNGTKMGAFRLSIRGRIIRSSPGIKASSGRSGEIPAPSPVTDRLQVQRPGKPVRPRCGRTMRGGLAGVQGPPVQREPAGLIWRTESAMRWA